MAGRTRDNLEITRTKLTEAQWIALDFLVRTGWKTGAMTGWVKTCKECTATTSAGLQRFNAVIHERRLMQRGPDKGKVVKRTKLKARGIQLAELGPPPEMVLPPGPYVWDKA